MTPKNTIKWLDRIESAVTTAGLVSVLLAWGCCIIGCIVLLATEFFGLGRGFLPVTATWWLFLAAGVFFFGSTYLCHRSLEKIEKIAIRARMAMDLDDEEDE